MKENGSLKKVSGKSGWFEYDEDADPTPMYDPDDDPTKKMWEEVERMKAEAEAEGEDVDEEWMNERYLELDREYEDSPPTEKEIAVQNKSMIQRQREFQRAAEYVAEEFSRMPEVLKVVTFGSVVSPLEVEVPRFRKFRRAGVAIHHECKDLDLAVWLSRTDNLRALQIARGRALNRLFADENVGVAHHQVDVFIMDPGTNRFLGNLCRYAKCPKGKPDCRVEGCGKTLYLKQHEDFSLYGDALSPDRIRILFERET